MHGYLGAGYTHHEMLTCKQKGKQFFAHRPLCSWAVINWCGGGSMKQVEYFIQSLCRALGDNGMRVFQKTPPILQVRTELPML